MQHTVVKLLRRKRGEMKMDGLKALRLQCGMTQAALALKLGVTQSVVAMWERGAVLPAASKLPEIADALNCSIDDLYGREPPERTAS